VPPLQEAAPALHLPHQVAVRAGLRRFWRVLTAQLEESRVAYEEAEYQKYALAKQVSQKMTADDWGWFENKRRGELEKERREREEDKKSLRDFKVALLEQSRSALPSDLSQPFAPPPPRKDATPADKLRSRIAFVKRSEGDEAKRAPHPDVLGPCEGGVRKRPRLEGGGEVAEGLSALAAYGSDDE
jgi:hypothetical protein